LAQRLLALLLPLAWAINLSAVKLVHLVQPLLDLTLALLG
jgi:hypothetical protein